MKNRFVKIASVALAGIMMSQSAFAMSDYKNILLTGVTGFLGIHILDYLLKHTNCSVYCIFARLCLDKTTIKKISCHFRKKMVYYFK